MVQLTTAASEAPGDTTLVYSGTVGNTIASPASFTASGNTLTFSAAGGEFELDQVGYSIGMTGFPNGTRVLEAGGFDGSTAPVTVSFAVPVTEFGVNAEEFDYGNYVVSFSVFDNLVLLGTFTANGNDPNMLSFEGARTTGSDVITSVVISDNGSNNIGLGPVSFADVPATSVPEPASLALLCTGLLGLGLVRRRRRRL